MKSVILTLLFISLVFNIHSRSQWVHLASGSGEGVSLAVDGNNIYCGSWFTGISLSTDSGSSWTWLGPTYTVRGILLTGSNLFAATDHTGIYLSTDNGSSWTAVNNGLNDPSTGTIINISNYLFTGTHIINGGTVYRSSNNGSSWEIKNNGLATDCVRHLTARGNDLFASTCGEGIFLSTNLGESWSAINNGLTDLDVGPIAFIGNKIFAGTVYDGIFLSTNNGSSWVQRNNGLNYTNIDGLATSGNYIFAGIGIINTGNDGVYMSSDDGENWVPVNEGFPTGNVYFYSMLVSGTYIYAGLSNGVWKRSISEITAVQNQNRNVPKSYSLFQNYPNPFNPSTKIKFNVANQPAETMLVIYDALGKEITTLVNRQLNPGSYEVNWNAADYPSGVYFYKLTAGDFSEVKKMVLLK